MAPEDVMNVLLKRYMDKGNIDEVNYQDFCNDIDGPLQLFGVGRDYNQSNNFFARNATHNVGVEILKLKPQDVDDILARLRTKCKQERIRIGEFLRDFDKLRSGFITFAQFRIGLNMAKITLSQAEFDLLC